MKQVVLDIETNSLFDYDSIHVAVTRDIKTDEVRIFRTVHANPKALQDHLDECELVVGHNILGFDQPALEYFGIYIKGKILDTLVLSHLINFNLSGGHSLENWGESFGIPKSQYNDFSKWSQELEDRCVIDTEINRRLFLKFKPYVDSSRWQPSIELEHFTASLCQALNITGFQFNKEEALKLQLEINEKVESLLKEFDEIFPPKKVLTRRITARATKHGSINASDFRFLPKDSNGARDLSMYIPGETYEFFDYEPFNPASPKQRVERLNEAGWKPYVKTKGHKDLLRTIGRNKPTDEQKVRLEEYKIFGWTCDEENLRTLPPSAPEGAHKLASYLLLSSRGRNLAEWLDCYNEKDGRVHGTFNHIGSWSHRASHTGPNMANIPSGDPYGHQFRALWNVPGDCKLVGVDADGIQLRIFAHLCNDPALIQAIEVGDKKNGTDIHSVNQRILGPICKTRDNAKTLIYALLLGASLPKVADILGCSKDEAAEGMERILAFYPGWKELKEGRLLREGEQGYIDCLDGRRLLLPEPRLALTGHLQSGEKIVMMKAACIWQRKLVKVPYKLVNWVHDEWQSQVLDTDDYPNIVAREQMAALLEAGQELRMNISTPGSPHIGYNWSETH